MNDLWLKLPIKEWLLTNWYGGYLPGLPDLCVGKLPSIFGMVGTQQWKVWFVETPAEATALKDALSKPVPLRGGFVDFASGPDAAVSKINTRKNYGETVAALYEPPEEAEGWPWISVFRLPSAAAAGPLSRELGRGVYSYEIDMTEAAALDRMARMQAITLSAGSRPEVVFPDRRKAN